MSLYTGLTGKIAISKGGAAAVDVLHMSGFNVEMSKDIIEVISFGRTTKEKFPGIKDWSASGDGSADFADGAGQDILMEAFNDGADIVATFYLDDDTFLEGTGLIESLSITNAADGKADISISLAGEDAVALTVPADPPVSTELAELAVASAAGSATNDTVLTIAPSTPGSGNKYVRKFGSVYTAFSFGDSLTTGWTEFASGDNLAASTNTKVTVAEVTEGNLAVSRGVAVLVKKT